MQTFFVRACFDLDCYWEGLAPVYRIYVDNELFTEREWRWSNRYLEETLQIQAPTGIYRVTLQAQLPHLVKFITSNHRINYGSARWIDQQHLEIYRPDQGETLDDLNPEHIVNTSCATY